MLLLLLVKLKVSRTVDGDQGSVYRNEKKSMTIDNGRIPDC